MPNGLDVHETVFCERCVATVCKICHTRPRSGKPCPNHTKDKEVAERLEEAGIGMTTPPPNSEAVDHPAHYGGADDPHEHVKCMEGTGLVHNAMLYNCTKYLWRAGKKGSALEDLRKARWYLDREIQRREKE